VVRFASILAAEDMVLVEAIATLALPVEIFTLNTGRLHQETIDMLNLSEQRYRINIKSVVPTQSDVDQFVSHYGLNGFYDSEEAKKACCRARKILPLDRALAGADAWLTGQRREQAVTRVELTFVENDDAHGMTKYNPLFDWSDLDVWTYLQLRNVPMHPLHRQGYPSIGCEPCTRPIRADENIRAGRWWWLQQENKECGLHVK
jgi:phosphoadenosine phosphosulfate reductase